MVIVLIAVVIDSWSPHCYRGRHCRCCRDHLDAIAEVVVVASAIAVAEVVAVPLSRSPWSRCRSHLVAGEVSYLVSRNGRMGDRRGRPPVVFTVVVVIVVAVTSPVVIAVATIVGDVAVMVVVVGVGVVRGRVVVVSTRITSAVAEGSSRFHADSEVAASKSSQLGSRSHAESLQDSEKTANTTAPNKAPDVVRRLQVCHGYGGLRLSITMATHFIVLFGPPVFDVFLRAGDHRLRHSIKSFPSPGNLMENKDKNAAYSKQRWVVSYRFGTAMGQRSTFNGRLKEVVLAFTVAPGRLGQRVRLTLPGAEPEDPWDVSYSRYMSSSWTAARPTLRLAPDPATVVAGAVSSHADMGTSF
ncbi:hypothetical protein EDB92DRAFT_1816567 [Lactarius akahatsu]|uniref:Uncharacterized protein n=1 Tax=Lactarius akahatsu TaxID=416441 RepID=A0AAD4QD96_9AGAM|nr:hypothetical protein EDB92DRAFT_1816567 [Lactarius akahatsu]